jgi:ATP-dependent DNA helicase PIF1
MRVRWHTRKSLEALDHTLQDLRMSQNRFGGAMFLLAGDFRQTQPVIPRSTTADELNVCLKSLILWKNVENAKYEQCSLNMQVELQNDQSGEIFSKQLLNIGNGKIPVDSSSGYIIFLTNYCHYIETKTELIEKVFSNIVQNYKDHVIIQIKLSKDINNLYGFNFIKSIN